jgi:TolB-like protein
MAIVAVALLLTAGGLWTGRQLLQKNAAATGDMPRVAVMAFENLGGPEDEPFTAGITEEITGRLANISGLRVVSRTSAMRFTGREMSMADLGKALTADYILEGTVRTDRGAGGTGTARVTPQLVRVADDVRIWQQSYDAALSPGDIFRVQAEIAARVAAGMQVTLGPQDRVHIAGIATHDSAAYRLYHLGRFHWQKRDDESLERAEQYFREAIGRDSTFADAWAGLSTATLTRLISFRTDAGYADAKPAIDAARRAVQLDSLSATAHAALGYALLNAEWNWAGADSAFRRAIALDPEYGPAHYWYAQLWWLQERWSDALVEAREAIDVDPLSVIAHLALARTLRLLGRTDEWLAENDRCIELQPEYPIPYIDRAEYDATLNRVEEAARNVRSYLSNLYVGRTIDEQTVSAVTSAAAGRGDVSKIGRLLGRIGVAETPGQTARWFALSGARDSAFAYLQTAVSTRSLQLVTFVPHLGPLLGTDPRWADFRKSMKLQTP